MDAIVKHITCKIVLLNGIFNNCGKKLKHSILIKRKGTWRRKKWEGIKMRNSLYVLTKMQGGTERLAEALQLRGFSVEMEDDCICLKNGTVRDREELKFFLDKLNIPV